MPPMLIARPEASLTLLAGFLLATTAPAVADDPPRPPLVRVAALQPKDRSVDFTLGTAEALAAVDTALEELAALIDRAAEAGCRVAALPEDTLGLLRWEAAHPKADDLRAVLPEAESRMLKRLGRAASQHRMVIVACNDAMDTEGRIFNTAFLIGPDGREIGRYRKVNLPFGEQSRTRGDGFPVFDAPGLGTVGMMICYDLVFPETARCLALAGADVVFAPTLGGASFGKGDMALAALRTRAADNFLYLVVSYRGSGSMIISPMGEILAEATGPDSLAIADIDPTSGREGGDAFNTQLDLRGRLFRERVPAAYGILTDPHPPVLDKVPSNVTPDHVIRTQAIALTVADAQLRQADTLARAGKHAEAIQLLERLCTDCRTSWVERAAQQRLKTLRATAPQP